MADCWSLRIARSILIPAALLALAASSNEVFARELTLAELEAVATLQQQSSAALSRKDWAVDAAIGRRVLDLYRNAKGPKAPESLAALHAIAVSEYLAGNLPIARGLYREELSYRRAESPPDWRGIVALLQTVGSVEIDLGNRGEGDRVFKEALAIVRQRFATDQAEMLRALDKAAYGAVMTANSTDLERYSREAVAIRRRMTPVPLFDLGHSLAQLGSAQVQQGRASDGALALREALDYQVRGQGADHPDTISTRNTLAAVLLMIGRPNESSPLLEESHRLAVAKFGANSPDAISVEMLLAAMAAMSGREADAENVYRRITAVVGTEKNNEYLLAGALDGLGKLLVAQGRSAEAEKIHRQLLAVQERINGKGHPLTASSLADLARDLAARNTFGEADALIDQAIAIERRVNPKGSMLASHLSIKGDIARSRGDQQQALKFAGQALAIQLAALGPNNIVVSAQQLKLGTLSDDLGRTADAERFYRAAIASAKTSDFIPIEAYSNLARIVGDKPGGTREALDLARTALKSARERRAARTAGGANRTGLSAASRATSLERLAADPRSYPYVRFADVAWVAAMTPALNTPSLRDEAFVAAQEAYLSRAAQAMARTAARAAAGKGKLGELVARQQQLSLEAKRWQENQLEALTRGDQQGAMRFQGLTAEAGVKLAEIDIEVDRRFPAYRAMLNPPPLNSAEVARLLRPDEGLLFVIPMLDRVMSFAVGPGGSSWHRSNLSKTEIDATQKRLLCQLDDASCGDPKSVASSRKVYDLAGAHRLYADIVKPVESALGGAKRLYVVNLGEFGRLPLGLLPTAIPAKAGASADGAAIAGSAWLADRYAMITLPSVASLRLAGKAGKPAPQAFVGYGAPVLRGTPPSAAELARSAPQGGLADIALLHSLKPLPATAQELQAQAASLGSNAKALRLGRAASEAAVRADKALGQARVITFATHSLMAGELEGFDEPGLVFSPPPVATPQDDGVLSASEAATLSLNADWVILSACNTAAGAEGAEALSGLARAFLFAGARSLLVSHWGLKDQATAALTVEALREDRALSRGAALQAAMKTMRTGKRADGSALEGWRPYWAHPAYWAGFSLIANSDQ